MPPLSGGSSSAAEAAHSNKPLVHTSGRPSEGDLTVLVQNGSRADLTVLPPPQQRPLRPRRSCRSCRSCCSRPCGVRRPSPRCLAAAAAVLLLLCFHWERPVGDLPGSGMAATDLRFAYEGRWLRGASSVEADWPCSSVRFSVGTGELATAALTLVWSGVRVRLNASGQSPNRLHCSALLLLAPLGPTLASSQSTAPCKVVSPPLTPYAPPQVRLNATVHDAAGAVLAAHTLVAPGWDVPFWGPHRAELSLPKAAAEVRLRLVWLLTMHCFTPYCLLTTHYLTYYLTTYHLLKKAS